MSRSACNRAVTLLISPEFEGIKTKITGWVWDVALLISPEFEGIKTLRMLYRVT